MKDSTLITVGRVIKLDMKLVTSGQIRTPEGIVFTADVVGEATVRSLISEDIKTAKGTGTGKSPQGAELHAYAACVRAFVMESPFPEAFAEDVERLDKENGKEESN